MTRNAQNGENKTMGKTCKSTPFPAGTSDEAILNALVLEWAKRNLTADGTLKPNSYAPIYFTRGDVKSQVRRIGGELVIFHPGKSIPLPQATTTYSMPAPLETPEAKPARVPSKKRKTRKKAKK